MAMAAPMPMNTEAQVLLLNRWLSPAYPVGAFAYSHGLELLVENGMIPDGDALETWLFDILHHGAGRADALFLAAAFLAPTSAKIQEVDAACRAFCASKERLLESDQQGLAFCEITATTHGFELGRLAYPVAVGRAAALAQLPLALTSQLFMQAVVSNMVAAALRLTVLGQSQAQILINNMAVSLPDIAKETASGDLSLLSSTAFLADIAAMQHETQYSRIFRT